MTTILVNDVYVNCETFCGKQSIVNVDCNYTKWEDNSMFEAFSGCYNLQSVKNINENVTNMYGAFSECGNLINVSSIPNSVETLTYAFSDCYNLTSVPQIPDSVISMDRSFYCCENLTSIPNIGNNVENMSGAFDGCYNLGGNIFIYSKNIEYAYDAFSDGPIKNVYIPYEYSNGYPTNTYNAFTDAGYDESGYYSNVYLKDLASYVNIITIGDWEYTEDMNYAVRYVGQNVNVTCNNEYNGSLLKYYGTAFKDNDIVENVDMNNVNIKSYTLNNSFHNCFNLITVYNIPNTVTSMFNAFENCYNLQEISGIPSSVTNISGCFSNCYSLISAPAIPNGITEMYRVFADCYSLTSLPSIPSSAETFSQAFMGCHLITDAPVLPEGSYAYQYTFMDCWSLINAPVLPESADGISYMFYNCFNLRTAPNIPASVSGLAWSVFYQCFNLTGNIYIHSENITNAKNFFYNTSLTKNVYIPFKYANDVNTKTYNSFINAGYKTDGSVCGVYLKDIDGEDIDLSDYTYNSINGNVTLLTYIGAGGDVDVPMV